MMEPVCLGAGGMIFVDPLFQACLVEVVRSSADLFGDKNVEYETKRQGLKDRPAGEWKGLPIIYDEGMMRILRPFFDEADGVFA